MCILLQSSELLTSLTVTLDMLGSELVRFAENGSVLVDATGIGKLSNKYKHL